jgi:hypothetical protein
MWRPVLHEMLPTARLWSSCGRREVGGVECQRFSDGTLTAAKDSLLVASEQPAGATATAQ